MNFWYIFLATLLGLGIGWYIATIQYKIASQASVWKLTDSQEQLATVKAALEKTQEHVLRVHEEVAILETTNLNLHHQLTDQQQAVQKMEDKLSLQFKNLANELLEEKSKKFTDQNQSNLETLLKPLGEKIQSFEKEVDRTNKEGLERNVALRTEINRLYTLNLQITKEAENLSKAIKGNHKTQGNWGELILESILQKSGLVKDREYQVQPSLLSEDGKRYQPDIIVKLPTDKKIIIDAKVSLLNYEQFFNTEIEEERAAQLKKHILSIRRHIHSLSEKNYQNLSETWGLDFVLLFIPIEPAFSLVIDHDYAVFSEAYEKNIILVSPSTLIATLRTIANIWKQDYQNQNALEIARQSGALYDKFVGFVEDLKQIGKQLDSTQKVYVDAMKKLYDGKGNMVKKVEQIKVLGANTTKALDPQLLIRAQADNLL